VDTSTAKKAVGMLPGEALGQTFDATATTIRAVVAWRPWWQTPNDSPMKLWITEVDSVGMPLTDRVIQEGPVIQVVFGDSINPIELRWNLDPPVELPNSGSYAVFVQQLCVGFFGLYISEADVLGGGHLWRTERSEFGGCYLREYPNAIVGRDLVFTVEFCEEGTPARRSTWGRVKSVYR